MVCACLAFAQVPVSLTMTAGLGERALPDDPLCRSNCTWFVNPPAYTATWGTDDTTAASGDTITEPIIHFTASYSLAVHSIAKSNFDVLVGGLAAPASNVTLVTDDSTPTTELVIGVALDNFSVCFSVLHRGW